MKKTQLSPKSFTPALGAYSHGYAIEVGNAKMIFVTSQLALDKNGALVSDEVGAQTKFVFENIKQILSEGGATFDDVVKVQIFLTDAKDFAKVSPIRNEYLGDAKPASTLVQVAALLHPGCKIAIDAIAIVSAP
jgi:reactive intermediate/imine deaminase